MNKILLYYNTIKDLKLIQIIYQLKKIVDKNKRKYIKYKFPQRITVNDVDLLINELDLEAEYLLRFDVDALLENRVILLNEEYQVDWRQWNVKEASHLWNFNLHYLEYLVPLAYQFAVSKKVCYLDKWKEIIVGWIDNASKDSFEPYTISLRIPNILISMSILRQVKPIESNLEEMINRSLYVQYKFLIDHKEYNLLANHFFENIKTIVIGSIYFDEKDVFEKNFKVFLEQIDEQILPDGMHFELSPMYHKIILEDLLRVYSALCSQKKEKYAKKLEMVIYRMTKAMWLLEVGMGRTPLFNDSGDNVAKSYKQLNSAARALVGIPKVQDSSGMLENSGYVKMCSAKSTLLFDCGALGPRYMSGHAHCDLLSFELSYQGVPIFVNSGTEKYQGDGRTFYRSTEAHNTMMVDNQQQSELWGEHRAARKAYDIKMYYEENKVEGTFYSYFHNRFGRCIIGKDACWRIRDQVKMKDSKNHIFRSFLHLSPDFYFERNTSCMYVIKSRDNDKIVANLVFDKEMHSEVHTEDKLCRYAKNFGTHERKSVLELSRKFSEKTNMEYTINFIG